MFENFYDVISAGQGFNGVLRHLLILAFTGLLVAAAVIDLRRFIIPNSLIVALLGLWPIWTVVSGAGSYALTIAAAALIFLLGIACYARKWMGGGDVKLITVLALWVGPAGIFPLLLYVSVAGGILSVCWLSPMRPRLAPVIGWAEGLRDNKHIPYGVAIAAGGLLSTNQLWFG